MASLRQVAQCIGITGTFSVLRDFFGYVSTPVPLSVLTQILRLKQKHCHLNLIRVGIESFTSADEREIDAAVQFTRDTYATVNLGVGRVLRFFITTDEATGQDNIGSGRGSMGSLREAWTLRTTHLTCSSC